MKARMPSEIKYAFRQLGKRPGFVAIAIVILAIGIGASTTLGTFIYALLLRPLPVPRPAQLVVATTVKSGPDGSGPNYDFSYPAYVQIRDQSQTLSGVLADSTSHRTMVTNGFGPGGPTEIRSNEVSGNYFSVLGVSTCLGRTLTPDDDRKDAPRAVAVVSYAFWQRIWGRSPEVLGKTILIDNVLMTVVGVAQPKFFGLDGYADDLWVPIQMLPILEPASPNQLQSLKEENLFVVGRLRPGIRREAANAELNVIFRAISRSPGVPRAADSEQVALEPGARGLGTGGMDLPWPTLTAVAGLVLVVACLNVGGLVLVRTVSRQREFAVRAALGGRRGQLLRGTAIECLILSLGGGLMGLGATYGITVALSHSQWQWTESSFDLVPNGTIFLFTLAVSAGAGILVGFIPVLRLSQIDLAAALKDQGMTATSASHHRVHRILAVVQISMSVCLLAAGGLLTQSLWNLRNVDLGFRRENLLLVSLLYDHYDANGQLKVMKDLLTGLEALPGVRSATIANRGLWGMGGQNGTKITIKGRAPRPNENMGVRLVYAGPHFFETTGVPLLQGHDFSEADIFPGAKPAQPLRHVVISESVARQFFADAEPIGREITLSNFGDAQIIGVAKNTIYKDYRDGGKSLVIYEPFTPSSSKSGIGGTGIALRTMGESLILAPSVYRTVQQIAPRVRANNPLTMEDMVNRDLSQRRTTARIAAGSGILALGLACLGLYGLLAYAVTLRTREIGVRIALGASARDILGLVMRQGIALSLVGCACGVAGALGLVRLIASELYGVSGADPFTLAAAVAVLVLAALFASWLPARNATRVDPLIALKSE